jgi:hypothetical protein
MEADSRLRWISEGVCRSLGIDEKAFHTLLEDEQASSLLSAFLDGEGAACRFSLMAPLLCSARLLADADHHASHASLVMYSADSYLGAHSRSSIGACRGGYQHPLLQL